MEGGLAGARPTAGRVLSLPQAAAIWSGIAIVFAAQAVTSSITQGRPIAWQWDVVHELIYWAWWAVASAFVARQARRHWIEPGSGIGPWLVHLGTGILTAPVQVSLTYLTHGVGLVAVGFLSTDMLGPWLQARGRSVLLLSFTGFLYYWVILGVYYALAYRRLYLLQRAETAEASLAALRTQLQPHFLFNTLNSVGVLARENPAAAEGVLAKLSELLRRVLRQEPGHEIPLREELAILEGYVAIQRVRFEERLRVTLEVPVELRRALVPELVLQPLVENAIRYAVETRVEGGRIDVSARREGERLVLEVQDDGPGWPNQSHHENGAIGVANTRARLARLYGSAHEFQLGSSSTGGLLVTMSLPYRDAREAGP